MAIEETSTGWQWGDRDIPDRSGSSSTSLAGKIWLGFKEMGKPEISAREAVVELFELCNRSVAWQRLNGFIFGYLSDPSEDELQVISTVLEIPMLANDSTSAD